MRLYYWLKNRVQMERMSILLVVVIIYLLMIFEFYSSQLVSKLTFYLRVLAMAPVNPGQIAYIGLFVLAALFFVWSTGIAVLSGLELVARLKAKKGNKKR
ncbi:MAG: hypothetical protein P4N41_13830 [Negativicutes bacterium]|nr:hypothetical protein [Negativicutes bacterium]MDR3590727.1 hypothetical protein [Negativicutes bacterium]